MELSIQCPRCGHRMIMRFGIYVKAKFDYNFNSEEIRGGSWCPLRDYYPKRKKWDAGYVSEMFDRIQEKKGLLGFFCRHCDRALPKEITKEILDYLQKRRILSKFGKKS